MIVVVDGLTMWSLAPTGRWVNGQRKQESGIENAQLRHGTQERLVAR
jgi:hypothetical protein